MTLNEILHYRFEQDTRPSTPPFLYQIYEACKDIPGTRKDQSYWDYLQKLSRQFERAYKNWEDVRGMASLLLDGAEHRKKLIRTGMEGWFLSFDTAGNLLPANMLSGMLEYGFNLNKDMRRRYDRRETHYLWKHHIEPYLERDRSLTLPVDVVMDEEFKLMRTGLLPRLQDNRLAAFRQQTDIRTGFVPTPLITYTLDEGRREITQQYPRIVTPYVTARPVHLSDDDLVGLTTLDQLAKCGHPIPRAVIELAQEYNYVPPEICNVDFARR